MRIKDIIHHLESMAPPMLQESYDNAGLITGKPGWTCSGVLVTLDTLPQTIDEAVQRGCNMVVSHHPIVFKGLKKITGAGYVEETIIRAIKQDVAIYAIHTNLDLVHRGVNARIAEKIGLQDTRILSPKPGQLLKLTVFVTTEHREALLQALFNAGAGNIGHYAECSFTLEGTGTFKAGADAQPFIGNKHERFAGTESRVEVILPIWKKKEVLHAMRTNHPYEEVAYYLHELANTHQEVGSGMIGMLPQPEQTIDFLQRLKSVFGTPVVKHTPAVQNQVRKIAVCGGAGQFLLNDAIASGADVYITSDIKYHEFFDAVGRLLLADIGHYESEQFTIDLLTEQISIKFPNFAVLKTGLNTNPVCYTT
ncbi:MAG TPA: Nif3-like dinuclear metal center hexameric protein [Ferruginibacter sp.]|nr:Nif3-like dinuclear metal center hexameric protein [Ferruginibacter sp.]HRO17072.1 Nif3-like dinuclear metal center hexameric protein [Ferruginibacter sp.]HRQ20149.1 Nif3-like dinuclear metal center hexameric protein [Ferruginibacter sp.]